MIIKSQKTFVTILFFLLHFSCGERSNSNKLEEIQTFKGIKLNSAIESVLFYKDLKVTSKEDYLRIEGDLLSKYHYNLLFDKYPVNFLDILLFEGKIFHLNVNVEIPFYGNENELFKDIFVKKYGQPDSIYGDNWNYLWKKQNYKIEIYPMHQHYIKTDYDDTINAPPKHVTWWIISYDSNFLSTKRKENQDSIKDQREKNRLNEI
jgi:hypothetical protein